VKRIEPVQPNFGIRIKKLRFDSNLSQQELADLCEVSVDQIANIERGKNFAGETTISMLADALKVPQPALFDYSENEAFVKSGGMKWRASRSSNTVQMRNRKLQITVRRNRNR
jgi:transcriptional regulator with XRE-family HTH domain